MMHPDLSAMKWMMTVATALTVVGCGDIKVVPPDVAKTNDGLAGDGGGGDKTDLALAEEAPVDLVTIEAMEDGEQVDSGGGCKTDEDCKAVVKDMPCFEAWCDNGECKTRQVPDGKSCDDGDSCTEGDRCVQGECKGHEKVCDDGDPCTKDSCVNGECVGKPACYDGDPCTKDTCVPQDSQLCEGGTPIDPSGYKCCHVPLSCVEPNPDCSGTECTCGGIVCPKEASDKCVKALGQKPKCSCGDLGKLCPIDQHCCAGKCVDKMQQCPAPL